MITKLFLIFLIQVVFLFGLKAQKKIIYGHVFDKEYLQPIKNVSVSNKSGQEVLTDSSGYYQIPIQNNDSLFFSFDGKKTEQFPTNPIFNFNLDILLHIKITNLPEVKVFNKNYHQDSIQNRNEYAKYFNYRPPGLNRLSDTRQIPGGIGVGLDFNQIINMFRFKKNRQSEALQNRLLYQEKNSYIDYRFNKSFVRKITHLFEPDLTKFMNLYRPDYELLILWNDLELAVYIQSCLEQFVRRYYY
ncbi:MAG: hypothetical protein QM539_02785 [Alphaproteobacteria bacterium]|nr:hypothetical protein [Alphaproteobacteria bacterium]